MMMTVISGGLLRFGVEPVTVWVTQSQSSSWTAGNPTRVADRTTTSYCCPDSRPNTTSLTLNNGSNPIRQRKPTEKAENVYTPVTDATASSCFMFHEFPRTQAGHGDFPGRTYFCRYNSEFCIYAARNLQLCVTSLGSHVQMLCFGTEKDTHVHVLLWIEGGQKTTELSINRMTHNYTTMVTATIDGRKKDYQLITHKKN